MAIKPSPYASAMNSLVRGARSALDSARVLTGQTLDEDLAIYNQLKPDDFKAIIGKYGVDDALQYIKTMEAKKMKEGG